MSREGFHYIDHTYRDTGCDMAPSCLSCPFAVCRYDPGFAEIRRREQQHGASRITVRRAFPHGRPLAARREVAP